MFDEEQKCLEEQQKQEYSKMARDAIAQSFKSRGLRSFAGGDFKLDNDKQKEDEPK